MVREKWEHLLSNSQQRPEPHKTINASIYRDRDMLNQCRFRCSYGTFSVASNTIEALGYKSESLLLYKETCFISNHMLKRQMACIGWKSLSEWALYTVFILIFMWNTQVWRKLMLQLSKITISLRLKSKTVLNIHVAYGTLVLSLIQHW